MAPASALRPLHCYSAGFLGPGAQARRVRAILRHAGWQVTTGRPGVDGHVGVWGRAPTARRGETVAARTGAALIRVEDAPLRSLRTGRDGDPPLGLTIDARGVHFDPSAPSDVEALLAGHPLDDAALLSRARDAVDRIRRARLSKYNAWPGIDPPPPGYVLVVDQTAGDAAVRASKATRATFAEMLVLAREEHPGAPILIRSHPETAAGARAGHFGPQDAGPDVTLSNAPHDPQTLLAGAVAVYTVSSGMGFEAILAGHRPVVMGRPFYAGWGLTDDRWPEDGTSRRARTLTAVQLAAVALILHPIWHDPWADGPGSLERVLDTLEADARAYRDDHAGWVATNIRLWKRGRFQRTLGRHRPMRFSRDPCALAARTGARVMNWAGQPAPPCPHVAVEDGFLRSRGLGAELVPALSLVLDDLGIYYDPARESRLERLIAQSVSLPDHALRRAEGLMTGIQTAGLSKYNAGRPPPDLPNGRLLLVPGQVEDDASIRLGAGEVRTNAALLAAARAAEPSSMILYKPHPDVEAGLRPGQIGAEDADLVVGRTDPALLLERVDALWTMTSTMGFEALLRGVPVVTLGAPFYAGWGLTDHRGPALPRRRTRPSLAGLTHAALIDYPRYWEPRTGRPCPPEVALIHLAAEGPTRGPALRLLAKAQGLLASRADLWR